MRIIFLTILGLILFCGFTQMTFDRTNTDQTISGKNSLEKYETFELYYYFAGFGSERGSMQPTFRVIGKNYVYTNEQNSSFYGNPYKKPENICEGTLRISSIDSILNLVKVIKDTLVFKSNICLSGGLHNILVRHEKTNVTFRLHNASDTTAQKIVDILNSNIPVDKQRLWLFDFPHTPVDKQRFWLFDFPDEK